jgi:hypothetical protein
MIETLSFGGKKIVEGRVPNRETWVPRLLDEFDANRKSIEHSHKIGGRWENSYLPVELVPSIREPMRFVREIGKEELGISSVVLFEPLSRTHNPYPPFWFNLAQPGERTGLHDHVNQSRLSAVTYLACEKNSGNLYFRMDGADDLEISPEVGKVVIFDPVLRHGVHENRSGSERISFAFNLFPFPFPTEEI